MESAEELFAEISDFMEANRRMLNAGEDVAILGLDGKVKQLCERVLALSPSEGARYADLLQKLFDDLTVLGRELEEKRDLLSAEICQLSSHKKANVAYKSADAVDGFASDNFSNNSAFSSNEKTPDTSKE